MWPCSCPTAASSWSRRPPPPHRPACWCRRQRVYRRGLGRSLSPRHLLPAVAAPPGEEETHRREAAAAQAARRARAQTHSSRVRVASRRARRPLLQTSVVAATRWRPPRLCRLLARRPHPRCPRSRWQRSCRCIPSPRRRRSRRPMRSTRPHSSRPLPPPSATGRRCTWPSRTGCSLQCTRARCLARCSRSSSRMSLHGCRRASSSRAFSSMRTPWR